MEIPKFLTYALLHVWYHKNICRKYCETEKVSSAIAQTFNNL